MVGSSTIQVQVSPFHARPLTIREGWLARAVALKNRRARSIAAGFGADAFREWPSETPTWRRKRRSCRPSPRLSAICAPSANDVALAGKEPRASPLLRLLAKILGIDGDGVEAPT
jgi:hypothetical protein